MQWNYIIVQALSSERLQGFKLRPILPPRQGLTPPLPLWQGLWPSRIGTAWASALPSLPAADTRVTSWEERRSAGDTGEGDSEGEGNTWPGANLLCTHSLTQSLTHSVTTSHTPPPSFLTCSSFILQLTDSVLHTLSSFCTLLSSDTFLCHLYLPHNSCLTAPLNRHCMPSSTRSAMLTIPMLFILALWDEIFSRLNYHNMNHNKHLVS